VPSVDEFAFVHDGAAFDPDLRGAFAELLDGAVLVALAFAALLAGRQRALARG
jgi:hypothetical protein